MFTRLREQRLADEGCAESELALHVRSRLSGPGSAGGACACAEERVVRQAAQDEEGDAPRIRGTRAPRTRADAPRTQGHAQRPQAQARRTHRAVPLDRLAGARERGQPVPRMPIGPCRRAQPWRPLSSRLSACAFAVLADALAEVADELDRAPLGCLPRRARSGPIRPRTRDRLPSKTSWVCAVT